MSLTKKSVVITGASSGIGKALSELCIARGFHVIGISRTIQAKEGLTPVTCDLTQTEKLESLLTPTIEAYNIAGLINCAGFGRFEPHEEHKTDTITQMTALNLTAPMILSKLLLRSIKKEQGFIINITSIEATKSSKFSAVYSATKSGLRAFGLALFEEVRKSGVQVVTINPDMTDTAFFEELRFKPHHEAVLDTKSIVQSVAMILDLPKEATITELTIRPQLFRIDKK